MTAQMNTSRNARHASVIEGATQGARRATVVVPSIAPPSWIAPNPEVPALVAQRRQFSEAYKHRVLTEVDACTKPGQIGALLRREGLYSSILNTWRGQRKRGQRGALSSKQRGPMVDPHRTDAKRIAQLERKCDRLRRSLAQAHTIIDVQKNFAPYWACPRPRSRTSAPNERPRRLVGAGRAGRGVQGDANPS